MKNLFLILSILIILAGCKVFEKQVTATITVHDTLKETIRDTLVKGISDTASIRALMKCDSLGNVYIKELYEYQSGHKIQVKTEFKDRWFTISCIVDSQNVYMKLKDRYKSTSKDTTIIKTIPVNSLNWYQKIAVKSFTYALIFILLLLISFIIYWFKFRRK
jgi:hypothetical protein